MSEIVSNDSDLLVLVDSDDQAIGLRDKLSCHVGQGVLHRALSVFLFNERGEVLLQKRASQKQLWGDCWSNSCCTHPFFGESPQDGARRRVRQELGLDVELEFVYKFEYQASWTESFAENELCSVFVGKVTQDPNVNEQEISEFKWVSPEFLDDIVVQDDPVYTPWLKLEWPELEQRGYPKTG